MTCTGCNRPHKPEAMKRALGAYWCVHCFPTAAGDLPADTRQACTAGPTPCGERAVIGGQCAAHHADEVMP